MKVYIGIPMYGGACAKFVGSLLKLRAVLQHLGYEVETDINNGCSVITKARNDIVSRFVASGFDVLLFIDADMAWNPVDAVKLLNLEHDFSAIAYRQKKEEVKFNCYIENGEAIGVGTGFMALKRDCLSKMMQAYPELAYDDDGEKYALFDFELKDRRYWGEDYTFCRRWKAIGGDIHIMADATIEHVGETSYTGNFNDYLKGTP